MKPSGYTAVGRRSERDPARRSAFRNETENHTMYRIGIDLGGTNIAGGLVNEKYEINLEILKKLK